MSTTLAKVARKLRGIQGRVGEAQREPGLLTAPAFSVALFTGVRGRELLRSSRPGPVAHCTSSRRTDAKSPCAAILWPWRQFTRGSSPAATVEGARRPLRIAFTTA